MFEIHLMQALTCSIIMVMFIKRTKANNTTYIQIAKSFREGKKVRQEVVLNLGRIDKILQSDVESLVQALLALKEEVSSRKGKTDEGEEEQKQS